MEGKKISFGFMKTKKAEKPVANEKKDYIECVEEKSIKVFGGEETKENTPLVIPMKPNTLMTVERMKEIAQQVESAIEEPEVIEKPPSPLQAPSGNETLDQMAVRELLQDAKKEVKIDLPVLTVPLPAKPVNEGEKESTLDDYEAVPIQDFGLAMLRGMGWTPSKEKSKYKPPQLRPKGLGLGADKVVKDKQKQKSSKDGKDEELCIVKNAYVKVITGKYSGYYGKVVSLDEDNGRVMVDITVKRETVSLSEFMMHPVTKAEFDKESKVINADSFDEYKKKESIQKSRSDKDKKASNSSRDISTHNVKYSDKEPSSSKDSERRYNRDEKTSRTDKDRSKNGRDRIDRDKEERDRDRSYRSTKRDASEERSQKKNNKYSSNESLDSNSDTERRTHKQKVRKKYSSQDSLSSQSESDIESKKKKERRRNSSDSESDYRSKKKSSEGKKDIDKKRKGKKKKRDRDRSPNYRKHRK